MSKQAKSHSRNSQRRSEKRARNRQANQEEFGFRPLPSEVVNVVGNPANFGGEPTMRLATLDDIEDDCPLCQELRRQILAGKAPQVLAFE